MLEYGSRGSIRLTQAKQNDPKCEKRGKHMPHCGQIGRVECFRERGEEKGAFPTAQSLNVVILYMLAGNWR